MPDERKTVSSVKTRIHEIQAELTRLHQEEQNLAKQEYDEILEEIQPFINKCFVQETHEGGHDIKHFAVITGYPELETTRGGVHFNKWQYPSMQFYYCDTMFCPTTITADHGSVENPFYFDTLFAGVLPPEYQNGAHDARDMERPWQECTQAMFIFYAERRYNEMIRKIFEPTTPPL